MPALHPFFYFVARRQWDRELRLFQVREGLAMSPLMTVLLGHGYDFGESILNHPPLKYEYDEMCAAMPREERDLLPVDETLFAPGDRLLQATRPPLDDEVDRTRKWVEPGLTDLEGRLFRCWRRVFSKCNRAEVILTRPFAREAAAVGFTGSHGMRFLEEEGAPYRHLNGGRGWGDPGPHRTAVFLLHDREAWPGGPGYIGAFGMDGISTTIWADRLAHGLEELLREPGFVIAEIRFERQQLPSRCSDLRWARELPVEVVFQCQL